MNNTSKIKLQDQPQISGNLTDYINELLGYQFDKDIQDLKITAPKEQAEENITLHCRITNTPDVIESEPTQKYEKEYMDNRGNVHKVDKNGKEIENNTSIWDKTFNKAKEINYNIDSWVNKPSDEMNKRKTEVGLDVLTAPLGIGKTATMLLAKKIAPFLGKNIAQSVAEGIGGGLVTGAVSGTIHNIENKDNGNSVATILEDTISNTGKGAIDGYTKGQLNQVIDPKNKNYIEFLLELLKHMKR